MKHGNGRNWSPYNLAGVSNDFSKRLHIIIISLSGSTYRGGHIRATIIGWYVNFFLEKYIVIVAYNNWIGSANCIIEKKLSSGWKPI